jgi:hypothetical protein
MPQHHHRVTRRRHQVVVFLEHPAILAVIKALLIEPIGQVLENLELTVASDSVVLS